MPKRTAILALYILTLAVSLAFGGSIIDRIVATVNGHIILQSDWEDEVRYEAFMDGHDLPQVTPEARKAALDRLIDQELLRQQINASDSFHAGEADVDNRLLEIRKHYDPSGNDAEWQQMLAKHGLTEAEVKDRIALQLSLMHLVDARLRPNVQVDEKSIARYYNQELLPQLQRSGNQSVALAAATPKIKELLTEQKVNELLVAWLQNLRSESTIRSDSSVSPGDQSP